MTPHRRLTVPLGGSAGLGVTRGWRQAQALAAAVRRAAIAGVEDVVPAATTVGVLVADGTDLAGVLDLASALAVTDEPAAGASVELDVCFDGADLGDVARRCGLPIGDLVATLAARPLTVGWLGFLPGFPYLVGLDGPLASVGRLARPRSRVPGGSFAVAGGFAGIYPSPSPGGWNVLGRTAVRLFDPSAPEPATFAPGDVLRIRPVAALASVETGSGEPRRPLEAAAGRRLTVLEAGTRTLVEDCGRFGVAHLGVPRAGPVDPLRHRIANLAVGNAGTAAAFEITGSGPTLRLECDAFVSLVGDCPLRIDGRELPGGSVQLVTAGQCVSAGVLRSGLAAYLAVSGGVEAPVVLGSRAADASSGLWPGALRRGDALGLGEQGRARGRVFEPRGPAGRLGLVPGPESRPAGHEHPAFRALVGTPFEVSSESDRVGTRLLPLEDAEALRAATGGLPAVASRAMVNGAVQLPPDGCPIVLGPDHGTVGGYPVVGVLAGASAPAFGQLRPGDVVTFAGAEAGSFDLSAAAAGAVTGWMPPPGRA